LLCVARIRTLFGGDERAVDSVGPAGLPLCLDIVHAIDLRDTIRQLLKTRTRGCTDAQLVKSVLLLNIAGSDRVDDLDVPPSNVAVIRPEHGLSPSGVKSFRNGPNRLC